MGHKALLVIDMQKGSFTPETPRHDTHGVINRINLLADRFRTSGNHVFYIQHDGTKHNEFIPNTEPWDIVSELQVSQEDILINKYANDVFYHSNLKSELETHHINKLYITGCATDFCVEATIQSALAKDYNITVVKDGHTTGNRPHLNAEKIIEHYNWVWQNMIPTKGIIKVESFEAIINTL
ncbi:isochorismatase family protein [Flavivirga jejuensis]|uniref:Isochorismatase family protein n=1 Tax=Flavivirga jejuensis TaxID=870487 RepID=A0ABT8WLC7_9FLAO|nr:isochorismatase family protein [Flavivirga jejuensis]MDO5973963.1 isochorismatase family protein [Flavivirga jejuensis]